MGVWLCAGELGVCLLHSRGSSFPECAPIFCWPLSSNELPPYVLSCQSLILSADWPYDECHADTTMPIGPICFCTRILHTHHTAPCTTSHRRGSTAPTARATGTHSAHIQLKTRCWGYQAGWNVRYLSCESACLALFKLVTTGRFDYMGSRLSWNTTVRQWPRVQTSKPPSLAAHLGANSW